MPVLLQPVPPTLSSDSLDAYTPYGYSGPLLRAGDPVAAEKVLRGAIGSLIEVLDDRGCASLFIRSHPLCGPAAAEFPPNLAIVTHGDIVVIDLKQSERDRWLQIRKNHRRDIVRLTESDFDISIDESGASLSTFAELYQQTMRRVNASDYYYFPMSYFDDILHMQGCRVILCNVCRNGRVACAGMFILCGTICSYHLGATDEEFLPYSPTKLMFWRMSNWASSQGLQYMNLGGGFGGQRDSLFTFKSGFSKVRAPFFTVRVVIRRSEYDRLCERKFGPCVPGVAANDITGFFPAYRRT